MSEAAQSNDVEDVLSSIRRLVSENAKAAQGRTALVLTDDHRVVQEDTTAADPMPQTETVATFSAPELPRIIKATAKKMGNAAPTVKVSKGTIPPAPPVHEVMGEREAPPTPRKSLVEENVQDAVLEEALSALDESFSTAEAGWHDVAPEEVQSFPESAPIHTDEQTVDTDDLREVVADIVRQELRGELGERITRNVRKLVRREIQRALTAQSID